MMNGLYIFILAHFHREKTPKCIRSISLTKMMTMTRQKNLECLTF